MADNFGLKIGVEGDMLVKGLAGSIDDNGDKAVKVAENMSSDISDVMNTLSDDTKTALPTDFSVDGNIKSSLDSVNSSIGIQGGLSLILKITNFNNYSSEDINQLTNEINLSYTTRSISLTFSKNRCKNNMKTAHTHKNVRCLDERICKKS